MTDVDVAPKQQLENAFLTFTEVSTELADSYAQLQQKIGQLSSEFAAARGERMRRLAEKEHFAHRFAQLLDTLPAAVVVVDENACVERFNPAASELFDSIAVGLPWQHLKDQFVSAHPHKKELRLKSGREVNFIERSLGGNAGSIMLLLDITETRQLQRQAERQQRLGAMGEMAAKLAHQIRTPLSSALLYNSHLSRQDLTSQQRSRFSRRARSCLLNVERQINDMLSYARGAEYQLHPLSLNKLLHELRQTLEPIARERNIALSGNDSGESAVIRGDRSALLGALMNIAVNAVDHTPDGGCVSIDLVVGAESWFIDFEDQGPGIPEELWQQIFDPFFTTRSQGTGLGLAVSRAVAEGHGGHIEVGIAVAGSGSRFRFSLPRAIRGQAEGNSESAGSKALHHSVEAV